MTEFNNDQLHSVIRSVDNWPRLGVTFRDITPLLQNPEAINFVTQSLVDLFSDKEFTHIGVIEARGFLFGSLVAAKKRLPIVLFRKPGKLPAQTIREDYSLEYGSEGLEVHTDSLNAGDKVLLVDDLIATGGTLSAAVNLCHRLGAEVAGAAAVIDLAFLPGSKNLIESGVCTRTLLSYEK